MAKRGAAFVKLQMDKSGEMNPLATEAPPVPQRVVNKLKTPLMNPAAYEVDRVVRSVQKERKRGTAGDVKRGTMLRQRLKSLMTRLPERQLAEVMQSALAKAAAATAPQPDVKVDVKQEIDDDIQLQRLQAEEQAAALAMMAGRPLAIEMDDLQITKHVGRVERLGEMIYQKTEQVGRSEDGELMIDGRIIPGSDYVMAFRGLFSNYKFAPKGMKQLVEKLRDMGMPRDLPTANLAKTLYDQTGRGMIPPGRHIKFMRLF